MDKAKRIIKILVLFSLIYSCFSLNVLEMKDKKREYVAINKIFYLENGEKVSLLSKDNFKNITLFFNNETKEINLKRLEDKDMVKFVNINKNVEFVFNDKEAKLNLDSNKHLLSINPIEYIEYREISGIKFSIAEIYGEKILKINNQIDILYKNSEKNYYENENKTIKLIIEKNREYITIKGVKNRIELIKK